MLTEAQMVSCVGKELVFDGISKFNADFRSVPYMDSKFMAITGSLFEFLNPMLDDTPAVKSAKRLPDDVRMYFSDITKLQSGETFRFHCVTWAIPDNALDVLTVEKYLVSTKFPIMGRAEWTSKSVWRIVGDGWRITFISDSNMFSSRLGLPKYTDSFKPRLLYNGTHFIHHGDPDKFTTLAMMIRLLTP